MKPVGEFSVLCWDVQGYESFANRINLVQKKIQYLMKY